MSIDGGTPDGAPGTDPSAQSTEQASAAPDAGSDPQSWDQLGWKNPDDLKRFVTQQRNEMRSLKAEVESLKGGDKPRTAAKAQPASEVAELRAELQFRDVVGELAPHLDRAKRERLQRLYAADRPTDLDHWVRSELAAVGWDKPATTSPAPVQPPAQAKHASTGAPVVGGRGIDPQTLGRDEWNALSGADLTRAWKARVNQDPTTGNKFAPRPKP